MNENKEPNQIIVALDNETDDGFDLVEKIESDADIQNMVYGYKIGSLWILEEGMQILEDLYFGGIEDHVLIVDMQKWPTDIPDIVAKQVNKIVNTNAVDELVACPMGGGRKSLETFTITCKENNVRPLCVLEMTHPESDSYLDGMSHMKILRDAATFGIDGYIIPATKEPRQEIKVFLEKTFPSLKAEFYSTGFKTQEGQTELMRKFGVKKFIVGRGIYDADEPEQAIIDIYEEINAKNEKDS